MIVRKSNKWIIGGLGLVLMLVLLVTGCAGPTTTPSLTPTPTSKATSAPTASPSPTPKPTSTATSAPVSFAGKTVSLIACASAGGGDDLMGRLVAKLIGRFLPGQPAVIVRDMPGGAYTEGANYAYKSKPDGLTILIASGANLLADLMKSKAAHYELIKMPAIMSTAACTVVIIAGGIIDKREDVPKAKGIKFGMSAGSGAWGFVLATDLLNIPTERLTLAYSGGSDAQRAFLSGEINCTVAALSRYEALAPLVAKGQAMLLYQQGLLDEKGNLVRDPKWPSTPTFEELYQTIKGKPPSGIAWDAYKAVVVLGSNYSQPLFLPPGTPDSIVRLYWDAADKMVKEKEFADSAERILGGKYTWKTGEAFQREFTLNYQVDPKALDYLRAAVAKYGLVIE